MTRETNNSIHLHYIFIFVSFLLHIVFFQGVKLVDTQKGKENVEINFIDKSNIRHQPTLSSDDLKKLNKKITDLTKKAQFKSNQKRRVLKQTRASDLIPNTSLFAQKKNRSRHSREDRKRPKGSRRKLKNGDKGTAFNNGQLSQNVSKNNRPKNKLPLGARISDAAATSVYDMLPGIEDGAVTALNTDQYSYYSFFSRANKEIRNRWIPPIQNFMASLGQKEKKRLKKKGAVNTIIEIILTKDGYFKEAYLLQKSGQKKLDLAALQSLKLSSPFLNPPQELVEKDGLIRLKFGFTIKFR